MKPMKQRIVKIGLAAGVVAFLLLLIWVFPMSMKTCYLRLEAPSLPEGMASAFSIASSKAYEPQYEITSTVQEGAFLVKIDREYMIPDRVEMRNEQAAEAVTRMELRGNAIGLADYTAASLDGGVIVRDENGATVLSQAALDTVASGVRHPWMIRALLTCILVFVLIGAAVLYVFRKHYGVITMTAIVAIGIGCAFMVFTAKTTGLFGKVIPFGSLDIPNWLPVILLTACMAVLLMLCLLVKECCKGCKVFIVLIYTAALLLGVGKMAFYTERVANTPDELAHLGYVAYLTKTGELVPQFENIELASLRSEDDHTMVMRFVPGTTSYLKHPPTYYHIMRLANAVEFQDDSTFVVQIERLRVFSMVFVVAAMVLLFYLGFTRLKKEPVVHLLYAAICTMVPMFAYTSSGVNNDSFSLLTVALFFWGILRYLENKRNAATYLLITAGISLSVITKVTAGIVVALTALLVLATSLVKERSARELLKPSFLLSLLMLLIPAAYFSYMLMEYGGIQPNMFALNPEYARATGFYTDVAARSSNSFVQYALYFFRKFMETWTGISSHISLLKSDSSWLSVQNVALVSIWFIPLLYTNRRLRGHSPYAVGMTAGCLAVFAAVIMQLFNGFNVFVGRGYMGGFQSRYYLCAIMFFAFAAALMVEKALCALNRTDAVAQCVRDFVKVATVVYVGVLFYEDILYFLMHYDCYVM